MSESNIEKRLKALVGAFRDTLTVEDFEWIDDYIEHGELGLACENFCAALRQEKVQLSSEVFHSLRAVATELAVATTLWEPLESQLIP